MKNFLSLALTLILASCAKDAPPRVSLNVQPAAAIPTQTGPDETCFIYPDKFDFVEIIEFARASASLDLSAKQKIALLASKVKALPNTSRIDRVLVLGLTDPTGRTDLNEALQWRRARSVWSLLRDQGFPGADVLPLKGQEWVVTRFELPESINLKSRAAVVAIKGSRFPDWYLERCPQPAQWPNFFKKRD